MQYPSISLLSQYNIRVFLLTVFLVSAFGTTSNAQEALLLTAERGETTHDIIFDRHIVYAGTHVVASPVADEMRNQLTPQEPQICLPEFDFHIPADMSVPARTSSIRFPRAGSSFSEKQETRELKPEALLDRIEPFELPVVSASRDEFRRPFERVLYSENLQENDDKSDPKTDDDDPPAKLPQGDRFHWRSAINQSLMLLGVQHGYALAVQEKTRRALANGNFFTDYARSVRGLHGWDDGNRFFTNYVAHPMQGALTGFIFIQNHDGAKKQKFADSKQYWKDRFKAFVWSTAWSTQWELGPVGQAAIGNLGQYKGMGYVDLVITPTVGTGWLVTEEAIDRYIIRHIENHSFVMRMFARVLLNPMRSVANVLRFKHPWYRDRPVGY